MEKYKFSKQDGGPIKKNEAFKWIDKYKKKNPDGPWAFFFGEDIIMKILRQDKAVGMRIYLGENDEGKLQMVLIGAREDGSSILPTELEGKDGTAPSAVLGDGGRPCPEYCP